MLRCFNPVISVDKGVGNHGNVMRVMIRVHIITSILLSYKRI